MQQVVATKLYQDDVSLCDTPEVIERSVIYGR